MIFVSFPWYEEEIDYIDPLRQKLKFIPFIVTNAMTLALWIFSLSSLLTQELDPDSNVIF